MLQHVRRLQASPQDGKTTVRKTIQANPIHKSHVT